MNVFLIPFLFCCYREEEEFLLDDEPDEVNKFYEEFLKNLP
jgi:hypothetical protein